MAFKLIHFLALLAPCISLASASAGLPIYRGPPRPYIDTPVHVDKLRTRDVDPSTLYPAYNLSVPIDHFQNESMYEPHSSGTFNLRYWFDATYYKPGGPVIVLQSGETSGVDRLEYLQKGILAQLSNATNGIGVVLEHRYYGTSLPVPDLSVKSLRFLTTEQALADEDYFARNVVFKSLEDQNLTAPNVPWISYGGSYAGAFSAFLRTQYPKTFWGSISSSGVTLAVEDYWAYWEPPRVFGPQACIKVQQQLINIVDNILLGVKDPQTTKKLKTAFGLANLTSDKDFGSLLSNGVGGWQSIVWTPEDNSPSFYNYCSNITSESVLFPSTTKLTSTVKDLIKAGGYDPNFQSLVTSMLNLIGLTNQTVSRCHSTNQDSCFSQYNNTENQRYDLSQTWRSWAYQTCTQWGYWQTGSGAPKSIMPIVSRTIDIEYSTITCREAFNISTSPNVAAINKYGGLNISYSRLAFIDGQWDPWRPATPHASPFNTTAHNRTNTINKPFTLIADAVHHWDEYGVFANETAAGLPPKPVADAQAYELKFVKSWLKEWKAAKKIESAPLKMQRVMR